MTALTRLSPAGIPGRRRRSSAVVVAYDVLLYAEAVRPARGVEASTALQAVTAPQAVVREILSLPLQARTPVVARAFEPSLHFIALAPAAARATEGFRMTAYLEQYDKVPYSILRYTIEWSAVEAELSTTLASAVWSVPTASGLAIDAESVSGSSALVTLSGGTVGRSAYHAVTCAATFASGAVRERSIGVRLVDRIVIGRRDKDPGDLARFVLDWSDWLKQYGTTVASGAWIVSDLLGVTTEASVTAANPTSITLSGGTVRGGKVFTVDNRIVAANGLRDMQSFEVRIVNL